jgi:hypothetical protein
MTRQSVVFVESEMIPNDIYRSLVERGTEMAEKEFLYDQLDGQTKSILAAISIEAKGIENCSVAESNLIAQSSNVYRDHIQEVARAKRDATVAKITYFATRSLFEAQRTVEATERASTRAAP